MNRIIDSHLDLAWNALGWDRDLTLPLTEINAAENGISDSNARGRATTCLPEMRAGGVSVCLATMLARVRPQAPADERRLSVDHRHPAAAYAAAQGQLAYYRLLEAQGEITLLRTAGDLRRHWRQPAGEAGKQPIGIILAMEGGDPIVAPNKAESWWRRPPLGQLGPLRPQPVRRGDRRVGPLTPAGRRLLAEFERRGMILDVTHLAEPGFTEALALFGGPVMASHNNCHA